MVGLRGPGRVAVGEIAADRLQVAMIGNGTMTLGGTVKTARMTLSGAGALDAGALAVGELISDSEGAGDHRLRAVKSAAVTSRGIGKVAVLGRPVCTVRNVGVSAIQSIHSGVSPSSSVSAAAVVAGRSEEHTSELQSLMRSS